MSPVLIPGDYSVAATAGSVDARLVQRADATKFGDQFAWPPNERSMAFWIAVFIIAPAALILVGWVVWECKYGKIGNDDVKVAIKEKKKEAQKKQALPKTKTRQ